jgi:hypothetical protein
MGYRDDFLAFFWSSSLTWHRLFANSLDGFRMEKTADRRGHQIRLSTIDWSSIPPASADAALNPAAFFRLSFRRIVSDSRPPRDGRSCLHFNSAIHFVSLAADQTDSSSFRLFVYSPVLHAAGGNQFISSLIIGTE